MTDSKYTAVESKKSDIRTTSKEEVHVGEVVCDDKQAGQHQPQVATLFYNVKEPVQQPIIFQEDNNLIYQHQTTLPQEQLQPTSMQTADAEGATEEEGHGKSDK